MGTLLTELQDLRRRLNQTIVAFSFGDRGRSSYDYVSRIALRA